MATSVAVQGNTTVLNDQSTGASVSTRGPVPPALEETRSQTTQDHKTGAQILLEPGTLAIVVHKIY